MNTCSITIYFKKFTVYSKVYVKWLIKLYVKVNSVDTSNECVVMNSDFSE